MSPKETKVVKMKPKMVTAYNMPYIVNKISDDYVKQQFERTLIRYLQAQLRTMPRVQDESGLQERFANLQRLLELTENLDTKFSWEKPE